MLQWQQLGFPHKLHLVELGPGRGTLMADLLRGTLPIRPFSRALSLHMVEVSSPSTDWLQPVRATRGSDSVYTIVRKPYLVFRMFISLETDVQT